MVSFCIRIKIVCVFFCFFSSFVFQIIFKIYYFVDSYEFFVSVSSDFFLFLYKWNIRLCLFVRNVDNCCAFQRHKRQRERERIKKEVLLRVLYNSRISRILNFVTFNIWLALICHLKNTIKMKRFIVFAFSSLKMWNYWIQTNKQNYTTSCVFAL